MAQEIGPLRRTLTWALVAGVFTGIIGMFAFDALPSVSAQTDTAAPTISSVAISSDTGDEDFYFDDDGVYGIGDSIKVTVTFSENVAVTGAPQLELDIGGSAKVAAYESVTNTDVVFSYTVAEGDSDTDGTALSANKLTLNGGSIKDAADNAANLSHTALAAQEDHQVDGVRPTISSVFFVPSTGGNDGVYTAGETLVTSAKFTEDVIVTGTPRMELDFEGTAKLADFEYAVPKCEGDPNQDFVFCGFSPGPWSVRGISLTFDYTIVSGDSDSDGAAVGANAVSLNGGAIKDAAGNNAVLTHEPVAEDPNYTVDADPNNPATGAPTISGTAQVGETLTASTSGISDADGLTNVSYNYQWLADDTDIDGATSSTYTVQSSDNDKVIKVRVTFTDDESNDETLPSAGTSAVVLGGL